MAQKQKEAKTSETQSAQSNEQQEQKESLLRKILNLPVNILGAVIGLFAGIIAAFKSIGKEAKDAKEYNSNKSDKEAFQSVEDLEQQQKEQERNEIAKKIKEQCPEAEINNEILDKAIEKAKKKNKAVNLMPEMAINYSLVMDKERGLILIANNLEAKKEEAVQVLIDKNEEFGTPLQEDTIMLLESRLRKAIEDKKQVELTVCDRTFVFDGKTGEYIAYDKKKEDLDKKTEIDPDKEPEPTPAQAKQSTKKEKLPNQTKGNKYEPER